MKRTGIIVAGWIAAGMGACASHAAPPTTKADDANAAPATQPARVRLGAVLSRRWTRYKAAWAGPDIAMQSKADAALVDAIFKSDPAEVATLRDEMAAEYRRLASAIKPDEFMQGRLAARLVVAWTRCPSGDEVSSAQKAVSQAVCFREMARWGTRALRHLGSGLPGEVMDKYRSFVPGTAVSVISLMLRALPFIENPAEVQKQLVEVRDALVKLTLFSEAKAAETRKTIDDFYDALSGSAAQQKAKAAVAALIGRFREAYNDRDAEKFASLWPSGHAKAAKIKDAELADAIPADLWKITHWQCVYIVIQDDRAAAYVVTRYRSKDGHEGAFKLQGFPAALHDKDGWRLK